MSRIARGEARLDPKLKASAEAILNKLGLSPSDAIRIFYRQVELHRGMPFEVRIPNEETLAAFRDLDEEKNLNEYEDFRELRRKLKV